MMNMANFLLTASSATAEAVGSQGTSNVPEWNWPVIIGVSSVIILIIAIILAVRKADKVFGKGFDD